MDTVYILHAFAKTTNCVDRKNMQTAAARYQEIKAKVVAARKTEKAASAKQKR
jgi:phage-related protein